MRRTNRQEAEAHYRAMDKLGEDLRAIRARVQLEKIEAHYDMRGPQFSRILAETLLDWYLENAERVSQSAKAKIKAAAA